MMMIVSIPHRYGKNSVEEIEAIRKRRFPFLIGTVRTVNPLHFFARSFWFPFLIGTVRTFNIEFLYILFYSFPFLIGTVRTFTPFNQQTENNYVSIPHRYGKNKTGQLEIQFQLG